MACRIAGREPAPLKVGPVVREQDGDVIEGVLLCSAAVCQREFPIVDGIPILVPDVRAYVQSQLAAITTRDDLSPFVDSLIGDCVDPGSELDRNRYHLSCYARGHWGDLDPDQPAEREGTLIDLFERALALVPEPLGGDWVDIGCSVGRGTLELARRTGRLTLGIDLNFAMLKLARQIAVTGRVTHPLRRVGMVYDWHSFELELPAAGQVDFWVCDATGLALPDDSFDGALSLNLLDCVASPVGHVIETGRVLRPGGHALFTSPYDWSTSVTQLEGWLGGHSQRTETGGDSVAAVRQIFTEAMPAEYRPALEPVAEADDLPWEVYVHERARMRYRAHALLCRAVARGNIGPSSESPGTSES